MTVRRFNYTGRKRLNQEDVRIFVSPSEGRPAVFDADIRLSDYGLPDDALVSVEAYRQTSWMRFPCGSVNGLDVPANRPLSEFDSSEGILFRVRITSASDPEGLLLAEADKIRPRLTEEADENRLSLLPTKPDDDLGDQLFRVDYSDRPLLLINARCGDWRSLARDPVFISFAFPSVLREIVTRILYIEEYFDTEDPVDWRAQWLKFCTLLPGVPEIPTEKEQEKYDDWIEDVVDAFCRRFRIFGTFSRTYWTEEEPE
jgi:hypothetical protein